MSGIKPNIAAILLIVLTACVKPYEFDVENYEKVLVVEGKISNVPGPYTVTLGYTYPIEENNGAKVTDATVWITDDQNNTYTYTHVSNGVYQSPNTLTGVAGRSYTLHIETAEGKRYTTDSEKMLIAPEIDSIYGKYAQTIDEELQQKVTGIQFYIDSDNDGNEARHFRYEWEDAYKIITPYQAAYDINREDSTIYRLDTAKGICYKEGKSIGLNFGSSVGTVSNKMLEFPVRFINEEDQYLRTRYSLLVRQFAISESAYLFYKKLKENNESGGSLFDKQTGSVFGNVYNENEPEEPVLGYFEVAGMTEKRQFFNNEDLDDRLSASSFLYDCMFFNTITTSLDSALYYLELTKGNIYFYDDFFLTVSIQTRECTTCDFYASITPPSYWIDK